FMKSGEINGAEYFAINHTSNVDLWGIEDKDLYISNLAIYRSFMSNKAEVQACLDRIGMKLSYLKGRIYSKELFDVDAAFISYRSGNLEFAEYIDLLIKNANTLKIDFARFKDLCQLAEVKKLEGKIDFEKANKERDLLIDQLEKGLSKNEVKELVANAVDFRGGNISQRSFHEYLLSGAKEIGVKTEEFRELAKYTEYLARYEEVDNTRVMTEIEKLEGEILDCLAKNDDERELSKLSKSFSIIQNIFELSLTREDYDYYKANKRSFNAENFADFFRRNQSKTDMSSESNTEIYRLTSYLDEMAKFYEYSFKRDEAFVRNMRFSETVLQQTRDDRRGTSHRPQVTVLITGGFHTENLSRLFKKEGISYVSILPKFKIEDNYRSPYFNLLAGGNNGVETMLEKVISKAPVSNMQIASKLEPLLAKEVYGETGIGLFRAAVIVQRELSNQKGVDVIGKNIAEMRLSENGKELVVILGDNGEAVSIGRNELAEKGVILISETSAGITAATSDQKPKKPAGAVTKWYEERMDIFGYLFGRLVGAPVVEELLYRGLPVLITACISYFLTGGINWGMIVAGASYLQVFFVAKFLSGH
ncbi:MAG: hypothetical protein PHW46_05890, partial [Candidatus Omnitrophica bacterium]|nr:hypothetical protein [Candidatus Omnitrophota bacterium]